MVYTDPQGGCLASLSMYTGFIQRWSLEQVDYMLHSLQSESGELQQSGWYIHSLYRYVLMAWLYYKYTQIFCISLYLIVIILNYVGLIIINGRVFVFGH